MTRVVKFEVPVRRLSEGGYVDALHEGLDLTQDEFRHYHHLGGGVRTHNTASLYQKVRFTCTPEQFTRFIVARNRRGIMGRIKELDPRIETAPARRVELDVSDR